MLPYISPISALYLPYISPMSPDPYVSRPEGWSEHGAAGEVAISLRAEVPEVRLHSRVRVRVRVSVRVRVRVRVRARVRVGARRGARGALPLCRGPTPTPHPYP